MENINPKFIVYGRLEEYLVSNGGGGTLSLG